MKQLSGFRDLVSIRQPGPTIARETLQHGFDISRNPIDFRRLLDEEEREPDGCRKVCID